VKFGIIKQCQRKKFFKFPKITENENYAILELPFTIDEIGTISEKKLQKALEKGIRKLRRMDITRAILSSTLKEILSPNIRLDDFRVFDGSLMFFHFAPDMAQCLCEKHNLEPPNIRIGIIEQNLSMISQSLIERLCYKSKYISLATEDTFAAKKYAERLIEQLGIVLEIRDIGMSDKGRDFSDIVVNVDEFSVSVPKADAKINNIVISDMEIEDTDTLDVLACLGLGVNDVKFKLNFERMLC